MRVLKNLQNFLLDQDYYIDIFNDCLHVYYYEDMLSLSDKLIVLKLKEFILEIIGRNLVVSRMDDHEVLIKGVIDDLRFKR